MKLAPKHRPSAKLAPKKRGFTLPEMMITMGIFGMVVAGFVSAHLFGLKQDELVQSKLGASDQARRSSGLLANDIRAAKIWFLGTYTPSTDTFVQVADGTAQGQALKLCLSTDTSIYIIYYFDSGTKCLYRKHSGQAATTIAQYLANQYYFSAEDYKGAPQTTRQQKGVIYTHLEFSQFQYPLTQVGSNKLYDTYILNMRFTCHVPDRQ